MADRIDKQAVLYLHKLDTDYECRDCAMFIPGKERCSIHGPSDIIRAWGSCGLFVRGDPMPDLHPMSNVTTDESGYVEHRSGYSCKRCEYFIAATWECQKVDSNSLGDDPGEIHPDACCNEWEVREGSTRLKKPRG